VESLNPLRTRRPGRTSLAEAKASTRRLSSYTTLIDGPENAKAKSSIKERKEKKKKKSSATLPIKRVLTP